MPFHIGDIQFFQGDQPFSILRATAADLQLATFASLTFNDQKNCMKGESIRHGASGHSFACSMVALQQQVLALCTQGATTQTPLASIKEWG